MRYGLLIIAVAFMVLLIEAGPIGPTLSGSSSGGNGLVQTNIDGSNIVAGTVSIARLPILTSYLDVNSTNNATTAFLPTPISINLLVNHVYFVQGYLAANDSTPSEGLKIDFFASGSYNITFYSLQTSFVSTAFNTTTNTTLPDYTSATATFAGGAVEISGVIKAGGNMALGIRFAQNTHSTGTATLSRGSFLMATDVTP